MRLTKIFALVAVIATLFTSCKKDDSGGGSGGFTVDDNGNVNVGSDAAGAMYAIDIKTYDGISGTSFDEEEVVTAWFGNAMAPSDAGVVKANDYELTNFGGGGFVWYTGFGFPGEIFNNGNSINWDVAGATGITAFNHTDNTAFPGGGTFSLPASININTNFTLSHAATPGADAVVYSVIGFNGQKHKSVVGSSSSVTFTPAEMQEVCDGGGDPIGFMVMPVTVKSSSYNGKKYYFVKQSEVLRETVSQ